MISQLKMMVARTPLIGTAARAVWALWKRVTVPFDNSGGYWESRYQQGLNSGGGSYGRLADFKAEVLNDFVTRNNIGSVLELGCGDGNQLILARYPKYIGLDVASSAIELCRKKFASDDTKTFAVCNPAELKDEKLPFSADMTMSLDVVYHLVEDEVFEPYMRLLFDAAERYVVVYSSNKNEKSAWTHVRHRKFTDWVEAHCPQWTMIKFIPNRYPLKSGQENETSFADFYIFEKTAVARTES